MAAGFARAGSITRGSRRAVSGIFCCPGVPRMQCGGNVFFQSGVSEISGWPATWSSALAMTRIPWVCAYSVRRFRLPMMCSASGTYSLPSACMKSYWVSTSQKMTLAMRPSLRNASVGNLSGESGECQQEAGETGRRVDGQTAGLQPQHNCDLVTGVLPRAPRAVRPHLEGEMLPLGGDEAELLEERGLAGESEHLGEPLQPRFSDERLEQRPPYPGALPLGPDGEARDLGQRLRVDFERAAPDDTAVQGRHLRNDVLLDVPAQVVVAARQDVPGRDVGRHEGLEGGNVGEDRPPHHHPRERGAGSREQCCSPQASSPLPAPCSLHASTSSRIPPPCSNSSCVTTSGGTTRITFGPAVLTSRPCSRAAAT